MCHIRHLGYADLDTDERRALTGAVPGIIDDDSREPCHPRTARALEMGGGHGSGGDAHVITVAVVVADDDPPGDRADDVPVAAATGAVPEKGTSPITWGAPTSTSSAPSPRASPCPEVAELAHLRRLVAKGVPLTVAQATRARRLIAALVQGPTRVAWRTRRLTSRLPPSRSAAARRCRTEHPDTHQAATRAGPHHRVAVQPHRRGHLLHRQQGQAHVPRDGHRARHHPARVAHNDASRRCFWPCASPLGKEVERIPLRMRSVVVDNEGVERSHAHIVLLIRERALDDGAVRDNRINCRRIADDAVRTATRIGSIEPPRFSDDRSGTGRWERAGG